MVTVEPGDSLSKIAQEQLRQADQWPVLFKASRGAPQPQGLLIKPQGGRGIARRQSAPRERLACPRAAQVDQRREPLLLPPREFFVEGVALLLEGVMGLAGSRV